MFKCIFAWALCGTLALFPALASAQSPVKAFPPGTFQNRAAINGGTAAAYQGPGDVVTFTSFGSCSFAYNAAYATGLNSACDLVDTATGAATCTLKVAATGTADLTSLSCVGGTLSVTTFCTVTHPTGCSITKVYDQTGNGHDWSQATLANMPPLVLSGIGSNPVISCKSSVVLTSNNVTLTVPFSLAGVLEQPALAPSANAFVFSSNANQTQIYWATTSGNLGQTSGGVQAPTATGVSLGAGHAVQASFASGTNNTVINVDGSSTTATSTPGTSTAATTICRNSAITNGNYVGEIGSNSQSAYNSSLRANVLTRWGI